MKKVRCGAPRKSSGKLAHAIARWAKKSENSARGLAHHYIVDVSGSHGRKIFATVLDLELKKMEHASSRSADYIKTWVEKARYHLHSKSSSWNIVDWSEEKKFTLKDQTGFPTTGPTRGFSGTFFQPRMRWKIDYGSACFFCARLR